MMCVSIFYLNDYLSKKYSKRLRSMNGKFQAENNEVITKDNYKNIVYKRIDYPACGVNRSIGFEKIHFDDDTTVIIETVHEPENSFLYIRSLLNFKSDHITTEKWILKNDTVFSETHIIGNAKHQLYFPFKFENDSLKVGYYNNKWTKYSQEN